MIPDTKQVFAHQRLAEIPLPAHTEYDMKKRVRIVFERLLPTITGMAVLDAGCGRGFFTAESVRRGAEAVAVDVGSTLVSRTKLRYHCTGVVADITQLPFRSRVFGAVLCSEVIEHVKIPENAVSEMCRVLKPGGVLALTTPNKLWLPMVKFADAAGLRRVGAMENWVWPWSLLRCMKRLGFSISSVLGFNFLPFFWPGLFGVVTLLDRLERFFPFAINIAISARKPIRECENPLNLK